MKGDKKVDLQALKDIANKLRIDSIVATNASKSGHPTSCASMAEIMSVLFFHTMKYKISAPRDPSADRFILSKGHAAPILYAAWAEAGLFPVEDLKNLRKLDSDLEGHPTPRLNFVDVGTGSLGQGLAVAAGMAYVGKYFDQAPYRVFCLVGDGEAAEGSVWEALHFAGHYKLDNLVVIFDVNRLGQSEPTSLQHQMDVYDARPLCLENPPLSLPRLTRAGDSPTLRIKRTGMERLWGGDGEKIIKHLQSLIKNQNITLKASPPVSAAPQVHIADVTLSSPPAYKKGELVATRLAYGTGLKKIADTNLRVIALDGDTKNSTFSDKLRAAYPERYIECFIAEQTLVGVATGAACRDRAVVFASTFAAFFTRTFDQIRMGAISQSNINLVGSHCGVSIGEDGPSQMGLEDIALFRAVPTATVFYPSDAVSTERSVELAANTRGICYIRTSRPNTAIIYDNDTVFKVGEAKIVRESAKDSILLIGSGVTLHEALAAADQLQQQGISARVLDPFTVKPLDEAAVRAHAHAVGGRVLVVEDHYQAGGLGEAVLSALALERSVVVQHLYVKEVPRSGPPQALLDKYGISSKNIVVAAGKLLAV
ncbi:unnamed protein product [Pieris macdunnoughi]|uniref:transketolase n=1 Tax=Pieris macdunnoughi TaxID=345717 RepID=A0A821RDW4_9NEOP|nr:unnamed protein product [Pieris macdunnoughi]